MAFARGIVLQPWKLQLRLFVLGRIFPSAGSRCGPVAHYSKEKMPKLAKAGKGLGPSLEKKVLPVVTDPEKLTTYVCGSNIYKTGEDVKLKEDSEYPDWLWTLRTGKAPSLEELDPNTLKYWRFAIRIQKRNQNAMLKGRKF